MLLDNWFKMYPLIGMISLTSGLLLLCSFVRRKSKVKETTTGIFEGSKSTSIHSINLLTNEDSAKVYRHGTRSSLSKSGHSISADRHSADVAIKVESEEPKVKVDKQQIAKEKVTETEPKVEQKKSKKLPKIKVNKSELSIATLVDSEEQLSILSIVKQASTSSIHSARSVHSVISGVDSEPEISTIRTIYKNKNKRPIKSIISHIESEEDSKSSED